MRAILSIETGDSTVRTLSCSLDRVTLAIMVAILNRRAGLHPMLRRWCDEITAIIGDPEDPIDGQMVSDDEPDSGNFMDAQEASDE